MWASYLNQMKQGYYPHLQSLLTYMLSTFAKLLILWSHVTIHISRNSMECASFTILKKPLLPPPTIILWYSYGCMNLINFEKYCTHYPSNNNQNVKIESQIKELSSFTLPGTRVHTAKTREVIGTGPLDEWGFSWRERTWHRLHWKACIDVHRCHSTQEPQAVKAVSNREVRNK